MNRTQQHQTQDQPATVARLGNAADLVRGWSGGNPDGGVNGGHVNLADLEDVDREDFT